MPSVDVPILQHRNGLDELATETYQLPTDISAATYAMRASGVVSVPIDDASDATPRRLHVSGRVDAVAWHVGIHLVGQPNPLVPPKPRDVDDDDVLPF
jgi:hypothetical protein